MVRSFTELRAACRSRANGFDLEDPLLEQALDAVDDRVDRLSSLVGSAVRANEDFVELVEPLLDLEAEAQKGSRPWRVVIDTPSENGRYIPTPVVQFCSGPPRFDRFILSFGGGEPVRRLDTRSVDDDPNLGAIRSKDVGRSKGWNLAAARDAFDQARIQRIAVLGSARVFPYPKPVDPSDLSRGFHEPDAKTTWGQTYTARVEREINHFLDAMERRRVPFTIVDGGWAGTREGSMGVPKIAHMFGIVHETDDGGYFPPVAIMPSAGAWDRVTTREDTYRAEGGTGSGQPTLHTYFEIPGVWGDDSKYLVGFSTGLLVFEPFGFWTHIEIANGVAQGKPVAVLRDPEGQYADELGSGVEFVEKPLELPGGGTKPFRVYANAGDAARWMDEHFRSSFETMG